MLMIKIDPIETTSLVSATTTTESTVDDSDEATTTALGVSSTLTTSMPPGYAHAESTQRYIDSLSDTQLIELEQRLIQKENEMLKVSDGVEIKIEIETPKTYIKHKQL